MIRRSVLALLVSALASACIGFTGDPTAPPATTASATRSATDAPTQAPSPDQVELTIYAAASLKGPLDRAADAYEAANPGVTLAISTDSSTALETQIELGAPADVFLSADVDNPQKLVDLGMSTTEATVFAGNTLIIVMPIDNPGAVATPFDLGKPGLRIIAAGDDVPISRYAKVVVGKLAAAPDAPDGLADAYASNVVSKEDNVKAVLAKIELGEGDAALVYKSDAAGSTKVATVEIPFEWNTWAIYAGVVLKDSPNVPAAAAFLDWLRGREGARFFVEAGFFIPPA